MQIVLFVEGETERRGVHEFIKRWLDPQTPKKVRIKPIKFDGCGDYMKRAGRKAEFHLGEEDVIAVFGLLDLYGLQGIEYPNNYSLDQKVEFARKEVYKKIPKELHGRFHQHFAVHELEAWLLSDRKLFSEIDLPANKCEKPEEVDFDEPPAKLLNKLYLKASHKTYGYRKVVHGTALLKRLDPEKVIAKCPRFDALVNDMLQTIKDFKAGKF